MKFFRDLGSYLFFGWFYLANGFAIVLILPFLYLTSLRAEAHRSFFRLERIWARLVLLFCGLRPRVVWHYRPAKKEQYIIAPNHTSMLDIHLTLRLFRSRFLFVGKTELAKIPLFGYFYRRSNLLVDRKSYGSRRQVFEKAGEKLEKGLGLCIYPEGGAQDQKILAPFKLGAFRLAASHNIPIIPVSYPDCRKRLPFGARGSGPGPLRAVVHAPLYPREDSPEEARRLREECYHVILQSLEQSYAHR